jgi:hypothetical protein
MSDMDVAVAPVTRARLTRLDQVVESVLSYAVDDVHVVMDFEPLRVKVDEVWLRAFLVEIVAWRLDCGAGEVAVGMRLEPDRIELGIWDDGSRPDVPDVVHVLAGRLGARVAVRMAVDGDIGVMAVVPREA